MRRRLLGLLALVFMAVPLPLAAAGTRILLVARDHEDHPLSGFRFAYQGIESLPTSQAGATELDLPPEHRPGQQIKIYLLVPASKRVEEWFLVNPQVNIPSGSTPAEVVLMRRSVFRQIAAEARDTSRQATCRSDELPAEERKRVLLEAAARHGLTAEQLEPALRSFAETQDPKDKGIAAYLKGEFSQAEELLNQAAGKKEIDFVETLRYLGASQYEQGKYRAAADTFQKAVALRGEDPELLSWLGEVSHQLAEWKDAEMWIRRALTIEEKRLSSGHPDLADNLNNLASLLLDTDRLTEAEPLMRRALEIQEESFGPSHPDLTTKLACLASLLQSTDRLAEAELLIRRAVEIDEKNLETSRRRLANHLGSLAILLATKGYRSDAESIMRRALTVAEASFGPDHPGVANVLSNLGLLLRVAKRFAEAESAVRRALAIDENSFGPDHPNVARDLNTLASLYKDTDRVEEAEPLIRRALAIDEKSFGPDHSRTAGDLYSLALLLQATGRIAESEPLLRRALASEERRLGPSHPWIATLLNGLAQALQAMDRLAEAELLLWRALEINRRRYGEAHPRTATCLSNLAQLLQAANRASEAEPLMCQAVAILQNLRFTNKREHQDFLAAVLNYIGLLQKMGKSEAEIGATIEVLVRPVR